VESRRKERNKENRSGKDAREFIKKSKQVYWEE